jgi:hypothetical protein
MIRKQVSLFLKNVPGELGRLAALLGDHQINIEALSIQDASSYVTELYQNRGRALGRFASRESYVSMKQDSVEFALIRLLVNDTDRAEALLNEEGFLFDMTPVVAILLDNRPGRLAEVASRFGQEGINIKYVYGSVADVDGRCLFVFCPQDIEHAARVFGDE